LNISRNINIYLHSFLRPPARRTACMISL
jgi:hypothetical protein